MQISRSKAFAVALLAGVSVCTLTACKKEAKTAANAQEEEMRRMEEEERLYQETEELSAKIAQALSEEQKEEAFKMLDDALANAKYAPFHARFFSQKLQALLDAGDEEAAEKLVLDAWKTRKDSARSAFGTIRSYWQRKENAEALSAWYDKLSAPETELPEENLADVFVWKFEAALAAGNVADAAKTVDELISRLSQDAAEKTVNSIFSSLIDQNKAEALEKILSEAKLDKPAFLLLKDIYTLRVQLAKKNWAAVEPLYKECAGKFADEKLVEITRDTISKLKTARQPETLDKIAEIAIAKAPDFKETSAIGAKYWIDNIEERAPEQLPARFSRLLEANVNPVEVGNLYERYFYQLYNDHANLVKLCDVGEKILAKCADDTNTLNSVALKLLDGAFIVHDFDKAVQRLEQGVPGKDELWHKMTIPKVKGHAVYEKAKKLADGEEKKKLLDESIALFSQFMEVYKNSQQEDEYDPTTGIAYCKEWILARNAARLERIWKEAGNAVEAEKNRAEAKAYYETALQKSANDPEALPILQKEVQTYNESK